MTIYLDHNATTPLREEARARWLEVAALGALNPSSVHGPGRAARQVVDEARERVAEALGVAEDEVVFTSGGTEADELALRGALAALGPDAPLAVSAAEHSAVLGTADALAEAGRRVERLPVDACARVDAERVVAFAREPGARALSLLAANNEVGTRTPLAELVGRARAARGDAAGALAVHTDAVQALGRVPVDLRGWGVDTAAFSAHKVGGPQGVGVLFVRAGAPFEAVRRGGGQEHGLRPGTEDVAGIAAAAVAIELAVEEQAAFAERAGRLARALWEGLVAAVPDAFLNGPPLDAHDRLPNTLNVGWPDNDGRVTVVRLDLEGLAVSAGSACASGSVEPSHVLRAMGLDEQRARGGLRLSIGRTTTDADCKRAVEILCAVARSSRASRDGA